MPGYSCVRAGRVGIDEESVDRRDAALGARDDCRGVDVFCPTGKSAIGGGYQMGDGHTGWIPWRDGPLGSSGWNAIAERGPGTVSETSMLVYAMCAVVTTDPIPPGTEL